jgi:hypothetical protein
MLKIFLEKRFSLKFSSDLYGVTDFKSSNQKIMKGKGFLQHFGNFL